MKSGLGSTNMAFARHDLAIDLGTANTVIIKDGAVIFDEPSAIAVLPEDGKPTKYLVAGNHAYALFENWRIKTIRPLQGDNASVYPGSVEFMLTEFIKVVGGKPSMIDRFRKHRPKMVVAVPHVVPDYLNDALKAVGEKMHYDVILIKKPLAAAVALGDGFPDQCGMFVDMGASSTEVSVLRNNEVLVHYSFPGAGDEFNSDIIEYVRNSYGVRVGFPTAEKAKVGLGIAPRDDSDEFFLRGPDLMTGAPVEVKLSSSDIASCLDSRLFRIELSLSHVLVTMSPELLSIIEKEGIWLMGGSSQMSGMAKRFSERLRVPCKLVPSPRQIAAWGAFKAMSII